MQDQMFYKEHKLWIFPHYVGMLSAPKSDYRIRIEMILIHYSYLNTHSFYAHVKMDLRPPH